jgi:hypothetical protein
MSVCSQWHYCQGASACPDCPSLFKRPVLHSSILLPNGKNRKIPLKSKTAPPPSAQFDLFGGAL